MRKIITADCETDPFLYGREPKPFLWGMYDGINYNEFNQTKKFIDFIKEQPSSIIYAHNGGKYDWMFLTQYIKPGQEIKFINGRLSSFKINNVEFRDSYNLLPVPLSAYKKDDFDYSKLEKDVRHLHKKEISKYLKNDCIYLYEIVSQFIENYGLNLTLASSAMKFWKKTYNIEMHESSKDFYTEIAPFYYGGRCQAFKKGIFKQKIKCIDINSAYPYAMTHVHPWGSAYDVLESIPERGVEQCFIELTCESYGAFPRREKNGLRFPDGEKHTYFITGWEYLTALKTRTIENVEILKVLKFRESITFKDYVSHFFAEKKKHKNCNKALYLIAKLFLNSLYGKLAANPANYQYYEAIDKEYTLQFYKEFGMKPAVEYENCQIMARDLYEDEQIYYNIAAAASITGFVRAMLWDAINKTKGVIYCDTDSIICTGYSNTTLSDKLGDWDLEGEFDYGAVAGKKLYALCGKKDKIVSKGVKLTKKEVFSVANGKTVTYYKDSPTYNKKTKSWGFIKRDIKPT